MNIYITYTRDKWYAQWL